MTEGLAAEKYRCITFYMIEFSTLYQTKPCIYHCIPCEQLLQVQGPSVTLRP